MQKHRAPAALRHLAPGTFVMILGLLTLTAPFLAPVRVALAALVSFYGVAVLAASVVTASRAGWGLLPALPAVFACYHIGYGLGFLWGVWDFLLRQRNAGRFVALTRS